MEKYSDSGLWVLAGVVAVVSGYFGYLIGCWTHNDNSKMEELRRWVKLEVDYEKSQAYMSGYDDCLKRFKFDRLKFLSNGPDFELRVWEAINKDDLESCQEK